MFQIRMKPVSLVKPLILVKNMKLFTVKYAI